MASRRFQSVSLYAILITGIICSWTLMNNGRWRSGKAIHDDIIEYYGYLPAVFIYDDVSMMYAKGNSYYRMRVWGKVVDDKALVQKYTYGLSILYSPFFFIGHVNAIISDEPANGYSTPYQFWLEFSAIFYLMLGLFYLRKTLLRYTDEKVTTIVLLALAFGTNLFHYTVSEGPMAHVYLFFLINVIIWHTIRFFEKPNWISILLLSFACGLAAVIRPVHLVIWIIPVMYGLTVKENLKGLLQFMKENLKYFLIVPIGSLAFGIPQLLYWNSTTGSWLYYSYNDEKFYWTDPKFLKLLFSFRKGWLIYTPLMFIAFFGIFQLKKVIPEWRKAVLGTLIMIVYIASCWWCWWYGGSFGQRTMIDIYGLMAIPLAAWLWVQFQKSKLRSASAIILLAGLIMLNIRQTRQYRTTLIHWDSMTSKAWLESFKHLDPPQNWSEYISAPDYEATKNGCR